MDRLNQPATIQQIRLMFAASSLLGLFMVLGVTWWRLSTLTAPAQADALRAFAVAGTGGVFVTTLLVRFVRNPLWTDSRGKVHPLWAVVFVSGLLVIPVIGRLTHEALPIVLGYVLGFDLVMLAVLLLLLSRNAGPRPS
jgi:hypothetical protein